MSIQTAGLALGVVLLGVAGGGAGCGEAAEGVVDAGQPDVWLPAPAASKVDILVVIPNSGSSVGDPGLSHLPMERLLGELAVAHPGASIHLGVVSSDLGAGIHTPPSCDEVGGDEGRLWNRPGIAWPGGTVCETAHFLDSTDRFLNFELAADGGVPLANFAGSPADAFDCYRATGAQGCGYVHTLGSMVAALEGCGTPGECRQPANEGFLRSDAYLAVVIVADQDDCSAPASSALFDPTQTGLTSELGPLGTYRCFEFGVLCNDVEVGRGAGVRSRCVPGSKSADPRYQLIPVEEIVRQLLALKPESPRMVYAAVLGGPTEVVQVGLDANGFPLVEATCHGTDSSVFQGGVAPGIRLRAFAEQLPPDRHRWLDLCSETAESAFTQIGRDLATALRGD